MWDYIKMKKIEFSNLQIKQDMDKILVLHFGQYLFLAMGLLIELTTFSDKSWTFTKLLFISFASVLFYKTLKNLYYTFWTFSIFFLLFYFTSLFGSFSGEGTFLLMSCYLFSCTLLSLEMYLLYSPIYYPVVRWWEYDFRYRHDLKALVTKINCEKNEEYIGRLTDVRRNAGCIQLFEKLKISEKVSINVTLDEVTTKILRGEVISKRQYSVGRPWNYGIKMSFENLEEQAQYKELEFNWKSDRQDKIKRKFEKSNQNVKNKTADEESNSTPL
jgi:hypothetical protein